MSKSEQTKKRIINCSLELFNELGPDNVSTVLIAKKLGISPGNLYYHYQNKGMIIREIYACFVSEYRDNWNSEEMRKPEFNVAERIVNNLRIFFKYRFLMNHMSALAHNDPLLREEFNKVARQRQSELFSYFQILEERGSMDFRNDPGTIQRLVEVLWFLGDFWLMKLNIRQGKIAELTSAMELEYLQVNLFLARQFMTEKGRMSLLPGY